MRQKYRRNNGIYETHKTPDDVLNKRIGLYTNDKRNI